MIIRIANEEVLASNDFTINQEMLNTPSVILNNVYPKSWEVDKDYTSRFYHPDDYSQCQIVEEHEAEEGQTAEGTSFQITADNTKLCEITHLKGQTTQNGTPTPSNPIPIETAIGRQEIDIVGKNLLDKSTIAKGDIVDANKTIRLTSRQNLWLKAGTYTFSCNNLASTYRYDIQVQNVGILPLSSYPAYIYESGWKTSSSFTFTTSQDGWCNLLISRENNQTLTPENVSNFNFQLEKNNEATEYEPFQSITKNIDLGYNLPTAYQRVEYIQNSSDAYIDTNFIPNQNTNVEIKVEVLNSGTRYIFGVSTTAKRYMLAQQSNGSKLIADLNSSSYRINSEIVGYETGTHIIKIQNKSMYVDGELKGTSSCPDFTCIYNAYLFGSNNGSTTQISSSKIYYCKIWDNTTLIRDMIPCYRKSDNEIGLYDLLGNKFYANSGTGTFTKGNDIENGIELCKIGDYQDSIKKSEGKNLFDGELEQGSYDNGTGEKQPNANLYRNKNIISVKPNTTYTFSINGTTQKYVVLYYGEDKSFLSIDTSLTTGTFTTPNNCYYLNFRCFQADYVNNFTSLNVMLNEGTTSLPYEPYLAKGKWYLEKHFKKYYLKDFTFSLSGLRQLSAKAPDGILKPSANNTTIQMLCSHYVKRTANSTYSRNQGISISQGKKIYIYDDNYNDQTSLGDYNTWVANNNPYFIAQLETPTYTEITNETLINELESLELLYGVNNVSVNGYLPGILGIHYNYYPYYEDLIFCGVVKNSGNISLNPRYPHYSTLQILDYKTFLSEGETLDFVIANKTILEAINEVIARISDYGFELGNVSILNSNEVIGAYSTKDKTAYDAFNYIADITQSRWTTRVLGVGRVAIDFYDPSLMPQGTGIEYNDTWFCQNNIIDMTYNYGTWNYRNKQVMTSNQVFGSIEQTQTIIYDGYANQLMTELPIGTISSITVDGVSTIIATNNEKAIGITADFYYTPGNNYFEKSMGISVGSQIVITYYPLVEGRQIVNNGVEIDRVSQATGTIGKISRYENRNDATTSLELQKIGQSYIKYKGTPEIKLTIKSENNVWNVGDRVYFNAPIPELKTEYMVRSKKTNYIKTANTIFYTFELISSFNSENEVNYFDNQRAKANGNIKEGQYISRNIDIEGQANIIFYDTEVEEIVANNTLQSKLEIVLGG